MKFGSLVTFVFPRSSIALQLLLLIFATVAFSECTSTGTGTTTATAGGPQQQQQPSTHRAIPTAYTTSGGGFVTMTNSMGIIRAWHEAHILEDNTTHFGANSGGSWFQIQLSYSQEFYEAAIGLNGESVTDFVTEWGNRYGQKMKAATASGKLRKFTFALQESIPALCLLNEFPDIDGKPFSEFLVNSLNGLFKGGMFPAANWRYYVTEMLSSYIPNANTALWSAKRTGFPGGVISIAATLGPDIYLNDLSSEFGNPELLGLPVNVTLLPIQYVSLRDGDEGSWDLTAAETDLVVSQRPGIFSEPEKHLFTILPTPTLVEVSSASSSAAALTGSPTLFKNFLVQELQATGIPSLIIDTIIEPCLPLGLQHLASPTEGDTNSTVSSWSPFYRYIDGGYTDNTDISHTISTMQKSCIDEPDNYDCDSKGLRLLNIVSESAKTALSGNNDDIPLLFANCNCDLTIYGAGTGPQLQIFEEEFPRDLTNTSIWHLYSTKEYRSLLPLGSPTKTKSYALRMNVTTVDNAAYGVTGGMNVELIVLFPDKPSDVIDTWPGWSSNFAFADIYAETAQDQYTTSKQLFKQWNLNTEWGNGSGMDPEPQPVTSLLLTTPLSVPPTKKSKQSKK